MKLKILTLLIISLQFTVLFQNCSSSFQTVDPDRNISSENSTPEDNSNRANSTPNICSFENGTGEYIPSQGQCVLKNCNQGFHLDSHSKTCLSNVQTCPQSNGSGQKEWVNGNWSQCQLVSCNVNFHKDTQTNSCVPNVRDCIVDSQNGNQTWNGSSWGSCTLSACPMGKHLENNTCVANLKSCTLSNGTGSQTWSGTNWGVCEIMSCNQNYHPDSGNQNCLPNSQSCQTALGNGTQVWNGSSWSSCQLQSCLGGYHLESGSCISDNKTCVMNDKLGGQTWTGSAWTSCLTCSESHTPLYNKCEPDYELVRQYSSFFTSCWNEGVFTCPIVAPAGYIGVPNKFYGDSATTFQFPVNYSGVSDILLNSSLVTLGGSGSSGCQVSILANGNNSKLVSITGCTGHGPLFFSIAAGSAKNTVGNLSAAISHSTTVMITNPLPSTAFTKSANLEYQGKTSKQKFDFYFPNDYQARKNIPIFIWIHGGGWSGGDKDADQEISEKVAKLGFFVINTNYTLSTANMGNYPQLTLPAAPYSEGVEDIKELVNYVKTAILQYNGDITKITIAGGSAGGHLALYQATRGDNITQFQCVVSAAGPTDLTSANSSDNYPVTKYIVNSVFGINNADLIKYSPALQTNNLKTQKLLLVHQLQDNLVPIDHNLRLAAKVSMNKPSIVLHRFFLNDPSNYPIFNPTPAQITHGSTVGVNDSIAAYVFKECQ